MTTQLAQKTIWITGANQGIGAALMTSMLDRGYQVVGIDKANTTENLKNLIHICDISKGNEIDALCSQLLQISPPDYFVHVAGVVCVKDHEKTTVDEWHNTFSVNTTAAFCFMRQLTPHFKKKQGGSVVFVSSNASRVPRMGMSAYGASKAALTYFAKTVGLELAEHGVRVNVVSPGSTLTPMQYNLWTKDKGEQMVISGDLKKFKLGIPLNKLATPTDIVTAIRFFIENESAHITMQDLVVDGGAILGG